jgi:hypothetical protein
MPIDQHDDLLSQVDMQVLEELNDKIGTKEDEGDRGWFIDLTAPEFAFMRADRKTFDDRVTFLLKVTPKKEAAAPRRTTDIKVISTPYNKNRAVVSCIVTIDKKRFHNLRLFVKLDDKWKLLGWANEEL